MFIDNNWWGHKYVLAQYCGIEEKNIFGSLQHGVYAIEEERIWNLKKNRNHDFIPYFCYSSFFYKKCLKEKINNIFPIGSPFIYLDKIMPKIKKNKGTIVFPSHSNFRIKKKSFTYSYFKNPTSFDHEGFINNVEKYNKPPYTVSIIQDDYEDLHKFYKRKNWKIFTAGNRYSKFFLINIYKEIAKNTHAVFSDFSSALYYSMFLGLKVRLAVKSLYSTKINLFNYNAQKLDFILFRAYKKKYPEIFFGKLDIDLSKSIAKDRMGYSFLKNKNELRNMLGWNSSIKLFLSNLISILYNLKYKYWLNQYNQKNYFNKKS
jgi:hypothetical protein